MKNPKQFFIATIFMLCASVSAHASVVYDVSFDTSAWQGSSGYLDLQFLPLDSAAPSAQASLTLYAGDSSLQAGAIVDGAVTGVLPETLSFSNSAVFNAFLQPLSFGTSITFRLSLAGDWETATEGSATTFSASLLNATYDALAPSTSIDLFPGGSTALNAGAARIAAVPLPAAGWLMLGGVAMLGSRMRKRR